MSHELLIIIVGLHTDYLWGSHSRDTRLTQGVLTLTHNTAPREVWRRRCRKSRLRGPGLSPLRQESLSLGSLEVLVSDSCRQNLLGMLAYRE